MEFEKQQLKERSLLTSLIYTILKKTKIYSLLEQAKKVNNLNKQKEDNIKEAIKKSEEKLREKNKWLKE